MDVSVSDAQARHHRQGLLIPTARSLVAGILENVPNAGRAVISIHCHDDLGMATANTLEALASGARQAECSVNGIGERTGTACLEEIVMALRARRDVLGLDTGLDTTKIYPASRLVSHFTGLPVQPNKAIVGDKAFAYTSGMYQNGVLRGRTEAESVSYTHLRAHETVLDLVCRLLLEKKNKYINI